MKKYKALGELLKKYRERKQENITHLASKLGVDRTYLSKLENGHEKPSETMLNILISHFSLSNVEASELKLASGYYGKTFAGPTKEVNMQDPQQTGAPKNQGEIQVKVPDNVQVLYTDSVWVTRSSWGIVLDFAQGIGPTTQQTVVSRVGMSIDHARALKDLLTKKIEEEDSNKQ